MAIQLTRLKFVNVYLVRESDGATLIDTGLPGSAEQIVAAATASDAAQKLGPIRRILLTHAHGDHIGSLDALAARLPEVEVAISLRESPLLPKKPAQDLSLAPGEPQCKIKGGLPGAATTAGRLLADGEIYGSLRAVATPGHTPGHFSFFDERDGTLYAGDALLTIGGAAHIPGFGPWYFPLAALATWHRPTAVASARRLLELPIRRIAAGHGRILEGPGLIESALRSAKG